MAAGDVVTALVSTANNATLDIHPGSGAEWFIHTLIGEKGQIFDVYLVDDAAGTNKKLTDSMPGGSIHGLTFRVNNTGWIQLKNTCGSTQFLGYQGVLTK